MCAHRWQAHQLQSKYIVPGRSRCQIQQAHTSTSDAGVDMSASILLLVLYPGVGVDMLAYTHFACQAHGEPTASQILPLHRALLTDSKSNAIKTDTYSEMPFSHFSRATRNLCVLPGSERTVYIDATNLFNCFYLQAKWGNNVPMRLLSLGTSEAGTIAQ
jgi:hypothetical protein